ncbi:putative dipeptidase PepE [Candidatus Thermoflexus japonica]|uniref:Putative dipeptidase PepE n=1 Tax=Candidatus Thermoflexus japonica TaxID=2035417 RepID=A0A2H5Y4X2_9CHLR|nr:putative dipeptidase PepE [Candidatus Thermoflexus japonica]
MSFAMGPFNAAYEARIDFAALRAARVARARAEMKAAGLDALLLFKDENVRYLTDLRAQQIAGKSSFLNGVLLAGDREPILLCSGGEVDRVRRTMPWIPDVRMIPILEEPSLIRAVVRHLLVPALSDLGLNRARVGIDAAPMALTMALQAELPGLGVEDGDGVMLRARMIKLPGELQALEEATAIADAVIAAAVAAVAEGTRECEVAGEAMRALFRLGGEYAHVMTPFVASGERMSPPNRFATDKVIRYGDVVFIDIGACWNGYYADVGRTVICGRPNARQKQIFRAVYEALQAGIEAMRPGRTNTEVAAAIRAVARRHGLEDRLLTLFIGHGIGMGANEPPYIGEPFPGAPEVELQPGMVFALEPLIWVEGVRGGGGVRLEEMIAITGEGPRVLSRAPFDERLLDGG